MPTLIPYLIFDIVFLATAIVFLFRKGAFWHPLTVYLFFHGYGFTWRAIQLIDGAVPMYGLLGDVIRPEEFQRALMLADVGLIAFVVGAIFGTQHFWEKAQHKITRVKASVRIISVISAICIPVGVVALFVTKTGVELSSTYAESSYVQVLNMWPISCLLALLFAKGFRGFTVLPICLYLAMVGLQGYHRFMLILPLMFVAAIYLQGKGRRWPTMAILIIGLAVMLIFPRLKPIGRAFEAGDYEAMASLVKESFTIVDDEKIIMKEDSEQFFDQYAGALSMIDDYDKVYWGSTYLAIITLPIPHEWWSKKPGLADHMHDISTSGRQYNIEGRIITYIGESYLNFRYFGIVLIPLALGFTLTYWCYVATSGPWLRLNRYVYTIAFMAFIQLFRDGLLSLVLFTMVHNLPLLFIWVAHKVAGRRLLIDDLPSGGSQSGRDLIPSAR
ncbi:MAG: hypothetical protein NTX20_08980 [Verrucomicrobia bacterium]|nr:hypothetical protein [Verrucomicrobiota bacterium]